MLRKFAILLFLAVTTFIVAQAEEWTIETLPMVHLQDARRYVCNPDGVLTPKAVTTTDSVLQALERDKGIQTVVVAVKQLKGEDPYQFGMDLARKYGIGAKKQRSGLIVILATEDRSYQVLTGNGLEGALPDAICRRIQNQVMLPALKVGNWDNAIVNTIKCIDSYVRKDNSLTAENEKDDDSSAALAGFIIALVFIISISYIFVHRAPKCPNCKTRMRKVSSQRVRTSAISNWKVCTIWQCPKCGNKITRYDDINNTHDGNAIPPILFGGGGRSGGASFGGENIGGSFGGGTFGGGGSGGRF